MTNPTFKLGDRVRVSADDRMTNRAYIGQEGRVKQAFSDYVSIDFDDQANLPLGDGGSWPNESIELVESYLLLDTDESDAGYRWVSDGTNWWLLTDKEYEGFEEGATEVTNPDLVKLDVDGVAAYIYEKWGILDDGRHGDIPEDEPEHLRGTAPLVLHHRTGRTYAKTLRSAKLGAEDMLVLWAACHGEEVDAYAFRKAVTHALRIAVTRVGKRYDSAYREVRARQAAHLLHIADAVIDNHRMGLDPLAPGERSPALAAEKERTTALIREKTQLEVQLEDTASQVAHLEQQLAEAARIAQVRDETLGEARVELDAAVARADEGWATAVEEQARADAAEERAKERQEALEAAVAEVANLKKAVESAERRAEAYRRTLAKAQNIFKEAGSDYHASVLDGYLQALLDL